MQGSVPYWGAGGVLDHVSEQIFNEPLVLLGEDGAPFFELGKDVAFLVEEPTWINNHIHALRPLDVNPSFLRHTLNCVDYGRYITGSTRDKLTQNDMLAIEVPRPSLDEQWRIADFLDATTAKFDQILTQRKAHKALLDARATSSLMRSVIAESEVWTHTRLKYLFSPARNGLWGSDPTGDTDDVTCVRVADFQRRSYRANPDAPTIRSIPATAVKDHILQPGDVLLEKSGGGEQSPVGFAVTFDGKARSICSNFVAALRATEGVNSRFACLLLAAFYRSGRNVPFIKQATGIQNLDGGAYLAQKVRVPDERQQIDIARRFDQEIEQMAALQSSIDRQLALLAERRQALITAAVTGQIDVTTARGATA